MNKKYNIIKRLILFFCGMSVIQFGVALFLKTNIGSDPFTVFTQGLSFMLNKTSINNIVEITPGIANMMISITLLVIIFLIEKNRINIGTLICVVGVGPIIDLGVKAVSYFPVETYNLFVKMLLVVLGCFIIAVGFSILSAANLGVAPNDIIPFLIQDKTKFQYKWIRMGMDAVLLVLGFLLGGVVGIGTIISMLATGPFIQICLPYGEKIVNAIVKENIEILENIQA